MSDNFRSSRGGLTIIAAAMLILFPANAKAQGNAATSSQAPGNQADAQKSRRPLTKDRATHMTDSDLEEAVLNGIDARFSGDAKRDALMHRRLTRGEKMVVATFECEGEVNNGGFVQYYWNGYGQSAQAAADGFRLIKAGRLANLVNRAIRIWAKDKQKLLAFKRQGTNEAFAESYKHTDLTKLDDKFYDIEKIENVTKLRAAYIRTHLDEFLGR
jgi:hypothetical protein